jgi:Membrane bound beta barrel domain (DUF5777)
MKKFIVFLLLIPFLVLAQSSWKRTEAPVVSKVELFHSPKTANYPTTVSLKQGNFMYEISHRFEKLSGGYDELYGLDGPVKMRTALSYGILDNLMITAGRSSYMDNLDFYLKYRLMEFDSESMPSVVSVLGGMAFNSEPAFDLEGLNSDYIQYYGQLIYNVMLFDKKLGVGIVPSFVYNSYIFAKRNNLDTKTTFTLGTYYQYYINRMWSVWLEFSPVLSGWKGNVEPNPSNEFRSHDALAFGFAIETGGHIFHLMITNSTRLNPTQFFVGAENGTDKDAWHFGFGITREL